jgi:geranylgeranyl reductase family protein
LLDFIDAVISYRGITLRPYMIRSRNTYDAAIIGAGPAGSTLAYCLAQRGIKSALIDKEKFPRNKVCAGGLPARVLEILPFDITPVIEKELSQVAFTQKLKALFTRAYHKPLLYTVNRERFDDFLVQKAEEIGVDFLESQKVQEVRLESGAWTVKTTHGIIRAALLVGADGAQSFVAKNLLLKPSNSFHYGLQVEVPIRLLREAQRLEKGIVLDWGSFEDSYGWIFPKRETASIGVGGPRGMGKQLKLYLYDLLRRYAISPEDHNLAAHLIPHRVRPSPIATERALLIGDAAGLVDFWTGEGIFYAIKSSLIAAEQIEGFLHGQFYSLKGYEAAVDRDIAPEIKTSYQFSKIFNHLSSAAFKIIGKYDYPWDVFCRTMRGDRTFRELKERFRPDILLAKLFIRHRRQNGGPG